MVNGDPLQMELAVFAAIDHLIQEIDVGKLRVREGGRRLGHTVRQVPMHSPHVAAMLGNQQHTLLLFRRWRLLAPLALRRAF